MCPFDDVILYKLHHSIHRKTGFSVVSIPTENKRSCFHPLEWHPNRRDGVSNHQFHHCLLNRLFRRRSKKTSKLRVTGLCARNSPVTGEFPAQMASNTENVSIWWRPHAPCCNFDCARCNLNNYINTTFEFPYVYLVRPCKIYATRSSPVHTWLFRGSVCALIFRSAYIVKMSWNFLYQIFQNSVLSPKCIADVQERL